METLSEPAEFIRGLPRPLQIQSWLATAMLFFHMAMLFWKAVKDPSLLAYFLMEAMFVAVLVRVLRFRAVKIREKMTAIDKTNMIVRLKPHERTIISANELFCKVSGYTEEEIKGSLHANMLPKHRAESDAYEKFWEHLLLGRSHTQTYERVAKSGESFWIQATYTPIHDGNGNIYEILKIASDVTTQAHDAMKLRHKNTYLEHAAKILRHDMHSGINTYIPRGIKALKRRLPEDAVKEFRLTTSLRLLEDGLAHTQKVYQGVREFTNLVKPGETLSTELVDLHQIIEDYLDTTSYKKQVVINELPEAHVNVALFCTAVDNLIRNGLKYNDSASAIVILTMLDEHHLGIIDNGRGMSQEEFEEYSKPYVRKSGQAEGGTGLGLNICIAILHEHGFPVSSERNPAAPGTTIKVKIK